MTREHRVRIRLKSNHLWDVQPRVEEISEIRDWVKQQCGWAEDRFEVKIHSSGSIMDIWFEDEKDAVMCALRWS